MKQDSPKDIAVAVRQVGYSYGDVRALNAVSFSVPRGQIFGLLGPNGGGKSTLFRLLSTLVPMQTGDISILGVDLRRQRAQIREKIGVVFQSPALDEKLTVEENLRHQGHLYGLRGAVLRQRIQHALTRFRLQDRRKQRTEFLSGGLKRRVELAKSLLHKPQVLILDEPSTGLDPGARHDLWTLLEDVRQQDQVTVLMTTHILEEAEGCDCVGILDRGDLVVTGAPQELEMRLGGDVITIRTADIRQLSHELEQQFEVRPRLVGGRLRIQDQRGQTLLQEIVQKYGPTLDSVTLARPTLEDVFIHYTGREFHEEANDIVGAADGKDEVSASASAPVAHT